jgi:hypothetical protein
MHWRSYRQLAPGRLYAVELCKWNHEAKFQGLCPHNCASNLAMQDERLNANLRSEHMRRAASICVVQSHTYAPQSLLYKDWIDTCPRIEYFLYQSRPTSYLNRDGLAQNVCVASCSHEQSETRQVASQCDCAWAGAALAEQW